MPVLTINPSASAHDAREVSTGNMTLTGNIALTAAAHWAGLYLPNVTVPPGATINAATRLFYMSGDAGRQDPALNWYAHDTDNADVFTTTNSNISTRTLTTAVVSDVASNIGTAADTDAYLDGVTVTGAAATTTLYARADFVNGEYPHIPANTEWLVSIDYDGGAGGDASDVSLTLILTEG